MRNVGVVCLAGVLVLSACGSDQDESFTASVVPSTSTVEALDSVVTTLPVACAAQLIRSAESEDSQSVGQSVLDQIMKTNVIVSAVDVVPAAAYVVENRGQEQICIRPSVVDVIEQVHTNLELVGAQFFSQRLPVPVGPITVIDINDRDHAFLSSSDGRPLSVGLQLLPPTYTDLIDQHVAITFVVYQSESGELVVVDQSDSASLTPELTIVAEAFKTNDIVELTDRVLSAVSEMNSSGTAGPELSEAYDRLEP